jgi:hypothetical protein
MSVGSRVYTRTQDISRMAVKERGMERKKDLAIRAEAHTTNRAQPCNQVRVCDELTDYMMYDAKTDGVVSMKESENMYEIVRV